MSKYEIYEVVLLSIFSRLIKIINVVWNMRQRICITKQSIGYFRMCMSRDTRQHFIIISRRRQTTILNVSATKNPFCSLGGAKFIKIRKENSLLSNDKPRLAFVILHGRYREYLRWEGVQLSPFEYVQIVCYCLTSRHRSDFIGWVWNMKEKGRGWLVFESGGGGGEGGKHVALSKRSATISWRGTYNQVLAEEPPRSPEMALSRLISSI